MKKLKKVELIFVLLLIVATASSFDLSPEYGNDFQGDIILTKTQKLLFSQKSKLVSTGLLNNFYRWPKNADGKVVIPFNFNSSNLHNFEERTIIYNGLRELERKVRCLQFIPRTTETDYVDVVEGTGCNSFLGKIGGRQELKLKRLSGGTTCVTNGVTMHEFIHALGYTHMQNRFDRDDYVVVYQDNIEPSRYPSNYGKVDPTLYGDFNTPYDFLSIMHYSRKAFLRTDIDQTLDAILPLPQYAQYNNVIGTRVLSPGDIARIRNMYQC